MRFEALGVGGPVAALVSGLVCPDRGRPSFCPCKIFDRGQIAKTHARTANIIVPPLGLHQPFCLGQRGEPVDVETFIPEEPIKRLDIGC